MGWTNVGRRQGWTAATAVINSLKRSCWRTICESTIGRDKEVDLLIPPLLQVVHDLQYSRPILMVMG